MEETKTYEELKKEYCKASRNLPQFQQILIGLETKYDDKFIECFEICEKLNKGVCELKNIALNANPNQKTEEYINLLIQTENKNQT